MRRPKLETTRDLMDDFQDQMSGQEEPFAVALWALMYLVFMAVSVPYDLLMWMIGADHE